MSEVSKAVFLSYASQDAEAAKRICDALRAAGVEVWFDQSELVGGDAWDAKIRGQISSCALFMPVVSANTQARREGYFRIEWKLAAQRTHAMADGTPFLVPIVIDETRDAAALVPAEFKVVQWSKLPGGETPPAFCARVGKLLSGEPEAGGNEQEAAGAALRRDGPIGSLHKAAPPIKSPSRWLAPVVAGGVIAVLALFFTRPWEKAKPTPAAAVTEAAAPALENSEIAQLWARLRPEKWQTGDYEAMAPALERLTRSSPGDADAWALLSIINSLQVTRNLQSGTRPLEQGKAAAERAQRLAPGSPRAELALGLHLTAMISRGGEVRAGLPHIERALAGLPRDPLTRSAELAAFWLGYDITETQRRAKAWLADEPRASYPAWILAESSLAARQPMEVERWARQAEVDDDITGVRSLVTLFESRYYLQADLPAARAALDRIPAARRAVPRVVFSRWLIAMGERNWDQALQEVARVPEPILFDRNFHGPKALLAGLAHQAANRMPAALAQFNEAERQLHEELAHDPENEELHAVLALTLACLGKSTEAQVELATVEPLLIGRDPSHYAAHETLLVAQTHGLLGDMEKLTQPLRWLFTHPSTVPLTPAMVRIDPRFSRFVSQPPVQALLAEFAALDRPAPSAAMPGLKSQTPDPGPSNPGQPDAKSVAVLAFANLSDDKANEYFSDGVSEELLNVLAKLPGLKVSARTSAFFYKGKQVAIKQIAQELGVAYVVEGSVRKSGDRVRITAQLIKADDSFHVWSDNFDRELKDIFAVQDEIAGLIAKNLSLKLGLAPVAAPGAAAPTQNLAAYDLYLRGRAVQTGGGTSSQLEAAGLVRLYEEALRLDPGYALASARLAQVFHSFRVNRYDRSEQNATRARTAALMAVRLDPHLPEAHLALAQVRQSVDYDLEAAQRELDEAERLRPNDPEAPAIRLELEFARGHWGDALVALASRAVELDPRNAGTLRGVAGNLREIGRFAEADRCYEQDWALAQEDSTPLRGRALNTLAWTGDLPGALAAFESIPGKFRDGMLFYRDRAGLQVMGGRFPSALADYEQARTNLASARLTTTGPRAVRISATYRIGQLEARLGRGAQAAELYTEALAASRHYAQDFPDEPYGPQSRAIIHALRGEKPEARAAMAEAMQLAARTHDASIIAGIRRANAEMLVLLGETAAAIAELRAVHEQGYGFGHLLRLQFEWEPLRGDATFQQLMKEAEARADAQPRPKQ